MATKNLVPRATGEGGIGTALKKWLNGYISHLFATDISSEDGTNTSTPAQIAGAVSNSHSQLHSASHSDGGTDEVTPLGIGARPLNGFVDRTSSTLAMNGSSFEITTAGSYDIWTNGNKYTKNTTQSVSISNDQTLHFVYFDSSGALQVSTDLWDILSDNAMVATVYKDGSAYVITDERHGWRRNRDWHKWAHTTIGARYASGFTGTFGDSSLSVTQGVLADEDIAFDSGGTKTTCQLWYRNSGLTAMRVELGVSVPYKSNAGTIQYDNAGTLTNVTAARYINSYVYATSVSAYPIVVIVGQAQHTTLTAARNEAAPSLLLSAAEWKLLYRVTYQNAAGTPTYVEALDLRLQSTGPATSAASVDHSGLTGRDAANQHPASAITNTPAGAIAATDVQTALNAHSANHEHGGSDEIATATAAANAIPKAGATGELAVGWIPTGTTAGKVVALDGSAKLPAVDGSQLTNLPASAGSDNLYRNTFYSM